MSRSHQPRLAAGSFLTAGRLKTLVHDSNLNLRHVEPTGMLGRVVQIESVQYAFCFRGRKHCIQAALSLGVQIIHDQPNLFGMLEIACSSDSATDFFHTRSSCAHPSASTILVSAFTGLAHLHRRARESAHALTSTPQLFHSKRVRPEIFVAALKTISENPSI